MTLEMIDRALTAVGCIFVARAVWRAWRFLFFDREGNSGRFGKHWSEE